MASAAPMKSFIILNPPFDKMSLHKTEGLILKSANWSESSQTITIFTPDMGKISLNIKGSRRLNGKRGRPLKFARLEINCYMRDGAESGHLSDIEPLEVFLFERDGQLGRLTFAAAAVELLDNLLTASDPQGSVYQITLSFLRMTDRIDKKRLPGLFAGYILRLISLLGYRPNLVGCVNCGREIQTVETAQDNNGRHFFSAERGGIVCDQCRGTAVTENRMIALSETERFHFLKILESSLEEASHIPISLKELNILMNLITALLKFHAGTFRGLKSLDFLDKLSRAVKTYGGL